jgi:hypothetical protein
MTQHFDIMTKAAAYSDWSRLSLFHVETQKYKQSPLIKIRKYFR